MEKPKSNWPLWLNSTVSILTLLTIVFYGGAMWKTVANHEDRINKLETHGSVTLQKHEALDDERIMGIKERTATVERATAALPVIQGDLRVIQQKLDGLAEQLRRHETAWPKTP